MLQPVLPDNREDKATEILIHSDKPRTCRPQQPGIYLVEQCLARVCFTKEIPSCW